MARKTIPVYLDDKLYKKWKKIFSHTSFSAWTRNQILVAVYGPDAVIADEERKFNQFKEQAKNGGLVKSKIQELNKEKDKENKRVIELSDKAREDIRHWRSMQVNAINTRDQNLMAKAISFRNYVCNKYNLSIDEIVDLSEGKNIRKEE